jgi:putative membrane protein
MNPGHPLLLPLLAALSLALLVSGWQPYERLTWFLEVAPVLVLMPLLWATRQRFRLTTLLYAWVAVHALVLMVGGAYTYARVPAGFWVQDWLALSRNPYDKLGHFMQGFVPALAAREVLLRLSPLRPGKLLAFLVLAVVMFVSSSYELIEWGAAVALGQGADEFLGTQGDPWDTQSDMGMALLGGVAALALLARQHDRQLQALGENKGLSQP